MLPPLVNFNPSPPRATFPVTVVAESELNVASPELLTVPSTEPAEVCHSSRFAVCPVEYPLTINPIDELDPAFKVVVSWTFNFEVPVPVFKTYKVSEAPTPEVTVTLST